MTEHWLHGEIELKVEVHEETECKLCIHNEVCDHVMELRCKNYTFGTSEYGGCIGCSHRFTRWDSKQPIPCFHCSSFRDQ